MKSKIQKQYMLTLNIIQGFAGVVIIIIGYYILKNL